MSSTSSVNGTTVVSGPDVIQVSDFYVHAGILHPLCIGSIAVIALFLCLRLGSNRSVAPITVFDWLINVALGSTLAGIVNGNSLVRGLLALGTMLAFQYTTSLISTRFDGRFGWLFQSPPLVVVFRGQMLLEVMTKHRISRADIYAALRQQGLLNVCQVECAIIEPNGTISAFSTKTLEDAGVEPDALMAVPAYKALCETLERSKSGGRCGSSSEDEKSRKDRSKDEEMGLPCRKNDEADSDMNDAANKCT